MVTAGGVGVLISNITLWTIYIRKIEGVAERPSGSQMSYSCGRMWMSGREGGSSGFFICANVARIILKRYLILENRCKILDSKGFIKNGLLHIFV